MAKGSKKGTKTKGVVTTNGHMMKGTMPKGMPKSGGMMNK